MESDDCVANAVVVTGVVAGLEPVWDCCWEEMEDRIVAAAEEAQVVLEKEQEVMMSTTSTTC